MTFLQFLTIETVVHELSSLLKETIFDDVSQLNSITNAEFKIDALARLLFYVRAHQGSTGNVDLNVFYSDIPLKDKLDRISTFVSGHPNNFDKVKNEVELDFERKQLYKIYGEISRFFAHPGRLPKGFEVPMYH